MFENLTEKLQRAFKNLRGRGKLTEEHLDAALAEIRDALLEGDVNVGVADELLTNIRKKAIGSEVMLQLSPDQHSQFSAHEFDDLLVGRELQHHFAADGFFAGVGEQLVGDSHVSVAFEQRIVDLR